MGRFYGEVGYSSDGGAVETKPGVWVQTDVVERKYHGKEKRLSKDVEVADKVNDDFTVGNLLSILADPYALNNFSKILYVRWQNQVWKVTKVDVKRPRLELRLGGVYHGPTAPTPGNP